MVKVNYHLTEQQIDRLKAESKRTGLTVAEMIRRAVDAWLNQSVKDDKMQALLEAEIVAGISAQEAAAKRLREIQETGLLT